jgi:hypothetical protein
MMNKHAVARRLQVESAMPAALRRALAADRAGRLIKTIAKGNVTILNFVSTVNIFIIIWLLTYDDMILVMLEPLINWHRARPSWIRQTGRTRAWKFSGVELQVCTAGKA